MGGAEQANPTSIQDCFAALSLSQVGRPLLQEQGPEGRDAGEPEYGDQRLTGCHLSLLLPQAHISSFLLTHSLKQGSWPLRAELTH